MKPIIGITPDWEAPGEFESRVTGAGRFLLRDEYAKSIERAGGIPIVLPYIKNAEEIISKIDGLVLTGGNFDVPPELSRINDPGKARKINRVRSEFEVKAFNSAMELNLPTFGICGGMQLIASLSGGKMIGDIATEVEGAFDHEQKIPPRELRHPVRPVLGSLLYRLVMKEQLGVNSTHHQAVEDPGICVVSAWSVDGIIEAIERPDKYWVLGVQWHPEILDEAHESHADIIRGFVRACIDRNRED